MTANTDNIQDFIDSGSVNLQQLIISAGDRYNLHSHTQFCDGRADMSVMADAAFNAGFLLYGFSPHSPICVESPCNMTKESAGEYLEECDRLKEEYDGRMRILSGMEIDWISEDFGPHIDYFQKLPLDYRIGSVHFVTSQDGVPIDVDGSAERFLRNLKLAFHEDLRYVVEKYFENVIRMTERGGFDILGHLDKIAANASAAMPGIEDFGWFAALVENVVDEALSSGVIVEINTKSFVKDGRFFPAERWWSLLKRIKAPLCVNSDAHYPDLVDAGRKEAFQRLHNIIEVV